MPRLPNTNRSFLEKYQHQLHFKLDRGLDLRNATISIDAMGCQREIAQAIIEGGGHYLLGLKGNQGTLHDDVRLFFEKPPSGTTFATHEDNDKGHGRIETRRCDVTNDTGWLQETHRWPGLKSIIRITATRIISSKTTTETRYYITDDTPDPARILADNRRQGHCCRGNAAVEQSQNRQHDSDIYSARGHGSYIGQ